MKKKLLILTAVTSAIGIAALYEQVFSDAGGRAGVTGSPNEQPCTQSGCHSDFTLNSGPGSLTISCSTMSGWQYTPSQVYKIDITGTHSGAKEFGIGFEALQSTGANGGTLAVVNATATQLKTKLVSGNNRTSMTHKQDACVANNTYTFSANWTAPAASVGTVTFYAAVNAANNDDAESGDYIYTQSQAVTPLVTGISQTEKGENAVTVFPTLVRQNLNVAYSLEAPGLVTIALYDIQGKLIKTLLAEHRAQGSHTTIFSMEGQFPQGMYFVRTGIGEMAHTAKIFIE